MGEFVAISGVIGANRVQIETILSEYALQRGGMFQTTSEYDEGNVVIIVETQENATVLYPDDFLEWDEASQFLSQKLSKPVFSLHIHDGDLWMYLLFNEGREVDRFNPLPDYWGKLTKEERMKWEGNATIVTQCIPHLSAPEIEKYLIRWKLLSFPDRKAYPDDEFPIGDSWQMVDFMRRIGLSYPVQEDGSIEGEMYHFQVKS
jgi:hypothetical protein